jgi:hypothetical protein|tara:strand:+ start:451 stop:579 length:129 start_codon:yes stop_codon:yes gene_type:complete
LHALGYCHVRSFDQQAFESLNLEGGELGGGPPTDQASFKTKR